MFCFNASLATSYRNMLREPCHFVALPSCHGHDMPWAHASPGLLYMYLHPRLSSTEK